MPRNRVQHQKGLSDDAFEQRYPDEEACRKAWFAWRWPEGFKSDGVRPSGRALRTGIDQTVARAGAMSAATPADAPVGCAWMSPEIWPPRSISSWP
jgi:hypothetical protein